jgi:hypothetical protein
VFGGTPAYFFFVVAAGITDYKGGIKYPQRVLFRHRSGTEAGTVFFRG